jgi:uncharacterized protein (DUF697 family)
MSEKTQRAEEIVGTYWKWAAAAGVLPPVIDMATVTAIQMKMVFDLARHYGVPYKKEWVKSLVGAAVGSISPPFIANASLRLLAPALKFVPVVGTVATLGAIPAFNAATTRALGKVFVMHFETGGHLLDMDPEKIAPAFQKQYEAERRQSGTATVTA